MNCIAQSTSQSTSRDSIETMKMLGLTAFLFCMFNDQVSMWFAAIIIINGIIGHSMHKTRYWIFDLLVNVILILWVNYYSEYPYTLLLTCIAVFGFTMNCCGILEPFMHVFLVQLPLAIALYHF